MFFLFTEISVVSNINENVKVRKWMGKKYTSSTIERMKPYVISYILHTYVLVCLHDLWVPIYLGYA